MARIPFSLAAVDVASNVVVSVTNCIVWTGVGVRPPSLSNRLHLTETMMSSGGIPCAVQLLVVGVAKSDMRNKPEVVPRSARTHFAWGYLFRMLRQL